MIDVAEYLSALEGFSPSGGDNALILCPFHEETNPSLWVNVKTGLFKCLSGSCGQVGNFTKLYAALEGITYNEAQEKLANAEDVNDIVGSILHSLDDEGEVRAAPFLNYKSFERSFVPVSESPDAVAYLRSDDRKIHDETIWDQFDLRFAVEGKFADRIMIPILDIKGRLVSFAARTIRKGVQPKTKKAFNTLKNVTLFGLFQLHEEQATRRIVVVEGEFDAMYLQQFGIPAVSTMGTSGLSDLQLALLIQHTDYVYLCYDGDLAGRKATKRDYDTLRKFVRCSVIQLPGCITGPKDGKDPNNLSLEEVYKYFHMFL